MLRNLRSCPNKRPLSRRKELVPYIENGLKLIPVRKNNVIKSSKDYVSYGSNCQSIRSVRNCRYPIYCMVCDRIYDPNLSTCHLDKTQL